MRCPEDVAARPCSNGAVRAVVAGLLFGCAASVAAAAPERELVVAGDLGARLDGTVQRSTGGAFWGAVLVARGEEVLLARGYGHADYASRPNTARSLFEIASVSKPFTATAVLRLAAAGRLRLDDTLPRFFGSVPADKRKLTVHQLLTHTAGLDPEVTLPYASTATRDEMVARVLGAPLAGPPGKFVYCNGGYALLAAVIEIVSKRPFEEAMRELVFEPAGMSDTGFIGDERLDDARVVARLSDSRPGATASDWFWGWGYRGMGGVVTTVWDLRRFDRALRGDALLDAAARRVAFTPQDQSYACGCLVERTGRGTTRLSHSGGVEGFVCNFVRLPEEDVVIVVLSNGHTDVHALSGVLEETLFPPPRVRAVLDASPYELSPHGAAEIEDGCRVVAERADGGVLLRVEDARREHVAAEIRIPAEDARKLAGDLGGCIEGRRARRAERCGAGLYLGAYAPDGGRLALEEGLALLVMPRYSGQDDRGRAVVDERIQLILLDRPRGQWPLMVRLDLETARALREGLLAALPGG